MVEIVINNASKQIDSRGNALKRGGSPEEIVSATVFLASPASTFTNGATVRADRGSPVSV
jgi:NAD(P)-dependent dehydrogenase (short-subunit alcohol dehydrogenase family)